LNLHPNPVIIVAAFSRTHSLSRLLNSLLLADYGGQKIKLVISLDYSPFQDVARIAGNLSWPFGEKIIIRHDEHLGLKRHIFSCLDFALNEEIVILLEDDLLVSPAFYQYVCQSYASLGDSGSVAGISLYSYREAESSSLPFEPLSDGYVNHFIQFPSSWGLAVTRKQWMEFRTWEIENSENTVKLPQFVADWGDNSWKKEMTKYLLATKKYFSFPNTSFTTNFSETGTNANQSNGFQSPLSLNVSSGAFAIPETSKSVYDVFFEPEFRIVKFLCPEISKNEIDVDLYGIKDKSFLNSQYILTSRKIHNPLRAFAGNLRPPLMNVSQSLPGNALVFGERKSAEMKPVSKESWAAAFVRNPVLTNSSSDNICGFRISVLIYDCDGGDFRKSVQSVWKQEYSNLDRIILADEPDLPEGEAAGWRFAGKMPIMGRDQMNHALSITDGDIMVFVPAGSEIQPFIFQTVSQIFSRFPELEWIIGQARSSQASKDSIPVSRLRFTPRQFSMKTVSQLKRIFVPSAVFFRRDLWKKTRNANYIDVDTDPFLHTWRYFMDAAALHPVASNFCITNDSAFPESKEKIFRGTVNPPGIFHRFLSAAGRPFFQMDIPIFRFLHYEKNHYPDVIRTPQNGTGWYRSRY